AVPRTAPCRRHGRQSRRDHETPALLPGSAVVTHIKVRWLARSAGDRVPDGAPATTGPAPPALGAERRRRVRIDITVADPRPRGPVTPGERGGASRLAQFRLSGVEP